MQLLAVILILIVVSAWDIITDKKSYYVLAWSSAALMGVVLIHYIWF